MRKPLLALFLALSISSFGQESEEPVIARQHELKLNALFALYGALEVGYEYVLNEESAVGVTVFNAFTDDTDINYMITPYYRYYFGEKPAAGFFMEGFGSLNSTDDFETDPETFISTEKKVTDFALGLGIGGKWISKRGVTFEINGGIGRNLFHEESNWNNYEFIGHGGLLVGYRF